jgi:AcrR family transcriptional regulator
MATTDLRERQRSATREQIIQAVHEVLIDEHPATLSMPQVADRAGMSLRTLYRYFPTKESLVDAASESFKTPASIVGGTVSVATLPEYLRAQWRGFTESIAAIKAQHMTPAGRQMRDRRVPSSRKAVRSALRDEGIEPDAALADLVIALMSSAMYLELVDRLGHDDEEAAELAAWTVGAVVERARREGGVR